MSGWKSPGLLVGGTRRGSRARPRRNRDYVEGRFTLRDARFTTAAIDEQIVPWYESLGAFYPLNAISLVGCYGDLARRRQAIPRRRQRRSPATTRRDGSTPSW